MSQPEAQTPIVAVEKPEDFEKVYDLPDPRSYYRALHPLDYRAPAILADYLTHHGAAIRAARGAQRLAVLDFCSGFGANGALLKHDLDLAGLYAFYSEAGDGKDPAFFQSRRASTAAFEIAGIDLAGRALTYARDCGLIDHGFTDNLVEGPPSPALGGFLRGADLVIEAGGIGAVMTQCYERLLKHLQGHHKGPSGPWFLICPRPDWDHRPLWDLFKRFGYRHETVSQPLLYRRLMAVEAPLAMAGAAAAGRDPAEHFRDGYYLMSLTLARPLADCEAFPATALMHPSGLIPTFGTLCFGRR